VAWPEISWQYLGGFFDGEGCVDCRETIQMWKGSPKACRQWRLKLYQNDRLVLDLIKEFLTEHGVSSRVEVHSRPDRISKGHSGSFALVVGGLMNTLKVLVQIEPYSIVKAHEIQIVFARVEELAKIANNGEMAFQGMELYRSAGSFLERS
jgi:hypothetical protein